MPFDNEAAKRALIQLLRGSRRAVLLVGAGSSIPVGYPSWPQLLEELRTAVAPELAQFPEIDLLSRAELIRTTLRSYPDHVDRRRQYEQLLSGRFGPRALSHALLTIESAATYVQINAGNDFQCGTIDLCGDSPNHAFHFLRGLGGGARPSAVLHVHGFWSASVGVSAAPALDNLTRRLMER